MRAPLFWDIRLRDRVTGAWAFLARTTDFLELELGVVGGESEREGSRGSLEVPSLVASFRLTPFRFLIEATCIVVLNPKI